MTPLRTAIRSITPRSIRPYLRRAEQRVVERLRSRHPNDYATHLPVLTGIGVLFSVKRIIELGSGLYSTRLFSNSQLFPIASEVISLENDEEWYNILFDHAASMPQLDLRLVYGSISSYIPRIDVGHYDLIFVDDSKTSEERSRTLRTIANMGSPKGLLVIHDFEIQAYQTSVNMLPYRMKISAFTPDTGIVWNGDLEIRQRLAFLRQLVRRYAKTIDPRDIDSWTNILSREAAKRWAGRLDYLNREPTR